MKLRTYDTGMYDTGTVAPLWKGMVGSAPVMHPRSGVPVYN